MNTKLVGISRTRTEQLYSERVLVKRKQGIVQNIGRKGVMEGGRKTAGGGGERQRYVLVLNSFEGGNESFKSPASKK